MNKTSENKLRRLIQEAFMGEVTDASQFPYPFCEIEIKNITNVTMEGKDFDIEFDNNVHIYGTYNGSNAMYLDEIGYNGKIRYLSEAREDWILTNFKDVLLKALSEYFQNHNAMQQQTPDEVSVEVPAEAGVINENDEEDIEFDNTEEDDAPNEFDNVDNEFVRSLNGNYVNVIVPDYCLPYLVNADTYGYSDEEIEAMHKFVEEYAGKLYRDLPVDAFCVPIDGVEPSFYRYNDVLNNGACDCYNFCFALKEQGDALNENIGGGDGDDIKMIEETLNGYQAVKFAKENKIKSKDKAALVYFRRIWRNAEIVDAKMPKYCQMIGTVGRNVNVFYNYAKDYYFGVIDKKSKPSKAGMQLDEEKLRRMIRESLIRRMDESRDDFESGDYTPSIYVGTWAKYNNGSLKGEWVNLAEYDSKESFLEYCNELHSDEEDPELDFQDYENIPDIFISGGYVDEALWDDYLENDDYSPAILYAVATEAQSVDDYKSMLDNMSVYYGCDTIEDVAYEIIKEQGEVPEWMYNYIEYERLGRECTWDWDSSEYEGKSMYEYYGVDEDDDFALGEEIANEFKGDKFLENYIDMRQVGEALESDGNWISSNDGMIQVY